MTIKLTEYSHGSGCGCKIAPEKLEQILKTNDNVPQFSNLRIGNYYKDDAAVYDLEDGRSLLSTTDFFMPIVDDPFTFGKIAATNALSDIYAMGGKPLMAIAILGWPIDKLDVEIARTVIEGGRNACTSIEIPIAGGHSIDSLEPIFGLAVTGIVQNRYLKTNQSAKPNCTLFLTKPIGIGILTTAEKQKKLQMEHRSLAIDTMLQMNSLGVEIAQLNGVASMTDVTGFGLLGHLIEICEASKISAQLDFTSLPQLPDLLNYIALGCIPGGTKRNYASYKDKVPALTDTQQAILCDPQTSGGLLVVVEDAAVPDFLELTARYDLDLKPIGRTLESQRYLVEVL